MLDRDKLLKELAAQVEFENTSQVQVDTDKFVATRGKEHRHQFLLDRERKSINAKPSHREKGQGAQSKENPQV